MISYNPIFTVSHFAHVPCISCVLTAVTLSGRLLLYLPPGCSGLSWQPVDLTPLMAHLFLGHSLPSSPTNSVGGQPEEFQGKKVLKPKETGSKRNKKTGKGNGGVPDRSNGNDGDDSLETSRPKRMRLSSYHQNLPDGKEVGQLVGVAFSTCAWLPTLLLASREGGGVAMAGVIAVATTFGQVVLFGVKLPFGR